MDTFESHDISFRARMNVAKFLPSEFDSDWPVMRALAKLSHELFGDRVRIRILEGGPPELCTWTSDTDPPLSTCYFTTTMFQAVEGLKRVLVPGADPEAIKAQVESHALRLIGFYLLERGKAVEASLSWLRAIALQVPTTWDVDLLPILKRQDPYETRISWLANVGFLIAHELAHAGAHVGDVYQWGDHVGRDAISDLVDSIFDRMRTLESFRDADGLRDDAAHEIAADLGAIDLLFRTRFVPPGQWYLVHIGNELQGTFAALEIVEQCKIYASVLAGDIGNTHAQVGANLLSIRNMATTTALCARASTNGDSALVRAELDQHYAALMPRFAAAFEGLRGAVDRLNRSYPTSYGKIYELIGTASVACVLTSAETPGTPAWGLKRFCRLARDFELTATESEHIEVLSRIALAGVAR